MQASNPYQAPASALETPNHDSIGGSLEAALNGDFKWSIGEVISESWKLQSGVKLPLWGGFILYYLAVLGVSFALGALLSPFLGELVGSVITQVVLGAVTWPMMAGLTMMAVKRAAGQSIRATMVFDYYPRTLPIFLLYLTMTLLIIIGFILLILPGIYLSIAFSMAVPLLVEKNLGVWEALQTSRKVITGCWFQMFGLILVMMILVVLSAIPLGIGLIWTLPMMTLTFGIIYRDIFGVSPAP